MNRPLVVVTDFVLEPLDEERRVLGGTADVVALNAHSEEALIGHVEQAAAIMVYHEISLTRAMIDRLEQCRLIVRCGVGVDNIDLAAARERGIDVANVPDYGTEEVADTAIGMMLTLTRGVHRLNHRLQARRGAWSYLEAAPIFRLRGRVFGIVGFGRIGQAAALRAKAFGMHVLFYDPHVPDGIDKTFGVERADDLSSLLCRADVLSTHCPLTPQTQHIIDADAIAQMQPGSIVINTARGGVVDVDAVLSAITDGHLAAAGIDVLETEPPDDTSPFITAWRDPSHPAHERIIVNPHSAFYCVEGLQDMRIKGSTNCLRVLEGAPARNVVN